MTDHNRTSWRRRARPVVLSISLLSLAMVATVASYATTLIGTQRVFPEFASSEAIAIAMALLFQGSLLAAPIAIATVRARSHKLVFVAVACIAWLFSTATSFVCFYQEYNRELLDNREVFSGLQELNIRLGGLRSTTQDALDRVISATTELDAKIERERRTGGALRSVSNPYLRSLLWNEPEQIRFDPNLVQDGEGPRFDFLNDVRSRLRSEAKSLENSIDEIDGQVDVLAGLESPSLMQMRTTALRAAGLERTHLLRSILPETESIDWDIPELRESTETERWNRALRQLFDRDTGALTLFAFAFSVDLLIVLLSYGSGNVSFEYDKKAGTGNGRSLASFVHEVAGTRDITLLAERWKSALGDKYITLGGRTYRELHLDRLKEPIDREIIGVLRFQGQISARDKDGSKPLLSSDAARVLGSIGERS